MSDPNRAPTLEELDAASEYAASKLCVQIPGRLKNGSTYWDTNMKKCRITQSGCAADINNPLSIDSFTSNGTILEWEKLNASQNFQKFWSVTPPEHLVWKLVKGTPQMVCARANYKLQQFCEFPGQRTSKNDDAFAGNTGKGNTNVPPFKYTVRNGKETCIIGKDYCDSKGMDYDASAEECYKGGYQQFLEFMMSTYLVAEMKKAGMVAPI